MFVLVLSKLNLLVVAAPYSWKPFPGDTFALQHPQRQPTFKWMKGRLIGKGTFGRVYLGMNTTTGEL